MYCVYERRPYQSDTMYYRNETVSLLRIKRITKQYQSLIQCNGSSIIVCYSPLQEQYHIWFDSLQDQYVLLSGTPRYRSSIRLLQFLTGSISITVLYTNYRSSIRVSTIPYGINITVLHCILEEQYHNVVQHTEACSQLAQCVTGEVSQLVLHTKRIVLYYNLTEHSPGVVSDADNVLPATCLCSPYSTLIKLSFYCLENSQISPLLISSFASYIRTIF